MLAPHFVAHVRDVDTEILILLCTGAPERDMRVPAPACPDVVAALLADVLAGLDAAAERPGWPPAPSVS